MSLAIEISGISVSIDSQLVAQQFNGGYEACEESMVRYMKTSHEFLANFESFEIVQIPREENGHADALANLGSASRIIKKKVIPFVYLDESSIETLKLK